MKKEKKELNFKLLTKRALALSMSVAILGASATLLTACGDDGANGKSAYELAVESGYTGTVEEWINSLVGDNGTDGEDGVSSYVGYDGRIWNGKERTEQVMAQISSTAETAENTLGITGDMSQFYEGSYLDLSSNRIALMSNYMPKTKATRYSGLKVKTIKVVTDKAGILNIGTAKVADVVSARANGGSCSFDISEYVVTKGENTITINLEVADDETIIMGGWGSVGLYVASGIPVEDEVGNFTLIDNKAHTSVLSSDGEYADTLAIQTTAEFVKEEKIFDSVLSDCPETGISGLTDVKPAYAPFTYQNANYFAGKKLYKIGVPVKTVSAIDGNQTFTLYVIKKSTVKDFATNYVSMHTLKLPVEALQGATSTGSGYSVNKWVYVDVSSLDLTLAGDESLAFCSASDSVTWGYKTSSGLDAYKFINSSGKTKTPENIYFDISYMTTSTIENHIKNLENAENLA